MAVNKNFVVKNGLEVDTNLIFADPANKRVGIASTTPNYTLNVAGGIGATDLYISGVSTFIGIGTFSSDVYVDGNLNVVGDITYDEVTGRNLKITGLSTFEGNSYFGSSVGIGTTNPDSALHIQSPSTSTTLTLTAPSAQPNKIQFQTYAGTLDAEIKNESSGLIFSTGTSPTTRYNIDSAGKHTFGSGSTNVQIDNAGAVTLTGSGSGNALLIYDGSSGEAIITYDGTYYAGSISGATANIVLTGSTGSAAFTGIISSPAGHFTGNVTPTTGEGVEIFAPSSGVGQIQSYDRSNTDWDTLRIKGSQLEFFTEGAERLSISAIGEIKVGSAFSVGQAGVVTATSYYGDGSNLTDAGTSLGMVIALSG